MIFLDKVLKLPCETRIFECVLKLACTRIGDGELKIVRQLIDLYF